jgi:hypothetical protein
LTNKRNSYRFDKRSKKEFKKDIAETSKTEQKLFKLWLDYLERTTGEKIEASFSGCGKGRGEYLEADEVNSNADYEVKGYGLIEVKFSKPMLDKFFHLKVGQVDSYLKQEASILMVIGSSTSHPKFAIITPTTMEYIRDNCKKIPWGGFGGKLSYRINVGMFAWRQLK